MAQPEQKPIWLILSHAFNMDGRAASQTITDKIPFLVEAGITPHVLSAVTGRLDQKIKHTQLLPWGPSGLRFDLRHFLRQRLKDQAGLYRILSTVSGLLLLPFILLEKILLGLQSHWSWALPAFFKGWKLCRSHKINLIYSTGGAYSAHLAGYWLKKVTGLPWIAEIHDPLVSPNPASPQNRNARLMKKLEGWICREADFVWWFTEGALRSASRRHPQVKGKVIMPGANPPVVKAAYERNAHLVFGHFGSLSATRSLSPFLKALADFFKKQPDAQHKIRLEIYGSDLKADPESQKLISLYDLTENVKVCGRLEFCDKTQLSGREQIMMRMQQMDCLLLMHGSTLECAEYIPSKVYEYFWAKRPVFGITYQNPQLDQLILERHGYIAATLNPEAILSQIEKIYGAWPAGQLVSETFYPPIGVERAVTEIIQSLQNQRI